MDLYICGVVDDIDDRYGGCVWRDTAWRRRGEGKMAWGTALDIRKKLFGREKRTSVVYERGVGRL